MARLSQDDALLITASGDRTVCAWDTSTGDAVACLAGHSGSVKSCNFWEASPTVVATGNRDGCVRVRPFAVPLPTPIHRVHCRAVPQDFDPCHGISLSGVQRRPACRSRRGVSLIMPMLQAARTGKQCSRRMRACCVLRAMPGLALQVFDLRSESVSMPGHWNHSHLPVLSIVVSAASANTAVPMVHRARFEDRVGFGPCGTFWTCVIVPRSTGLPSDQCLLDED